MKFWCAIAGLLLLIGAAQAQEEPGCGSLNNPAYGPFDYRTATVFEKNMVQNAHFTPGVESLRVRKTGPLGHDIGYTLRAFPNHPRALAAMQRLAEKEKRDPPEGAPYSVECFYERGLRFRPDDSGVRLLYANYMLGRGKTEEARRHLEYLSKVATEEALTLHNIGLLYFDMGDYALALEHEHRASALGLQRTDLKERLQKAGQWSEPPADPASAAASAPVGTQAPKP